MLPGLTATMGIALLTGLTFQWESSNAIVILIAIYVGAIYGGSRSAILVNIPGTPANAAACIDGHPLALQGKAGEAQVEGARFIIENTGGGAFMDNHFTILGNEIP